MIEIEAAVTSNFFQSLNGNSNVGKQSSQKTDDTKANNSIFKKTFSNVRKNDEKKQKKNDIYGLLSLSPAELQKKLEKMSEGDLKKLKKLLGGSFQKFLSKLKNLELNSDFKNLKLKWEILQFNFNKKNIPVELAGDLKNHIQDLLEKVNIDSSDLNHNKSRISTKKDQQFDLKFSSDLDKILSQLAAMNDDQKLDLLKQLSVNKLEKLQQLLKNYNLVQKSSDSVEGKQKISKTGVFQLTSLLTDVIQDKKSKKDNKLIMSTKDNQVLTDKEIKKLNSIDKKSNNEKMNNKILDNKTFNNNIGKKGNNKNAKNQRLSKESLDMKLTSSSTGKITNKNQSITELFKINNASGKDSDESFIKSNKIDHLFLLNYSNNTKSVSTKLSNPQIQQPNMRDVINQITEQIKAYHQPGNNKIKIQLEPDFLGKVNLDLQVKGGEVSAKFIVDNLFVKDHLEHNLQGLKYNLIKQGFNVDNIEVETNNHDFNLHQEADSQDQSQSDQQFNHNQQQESFDFTQEQLAELSPEQLEELIDNVPEGLSSLQNDYWFKPGYVYRGMNFLA